MLNGNHTTDIAPVSKFNFDLVTNLSVKMLAHFSECQRLDQKYVSSYYYSNVSYSIERRAWFNIGSYQMYDC